MPAQWFFTTTWIVTVPPVGVYFFRRLRGPTPSCSLLTLASLYWFTDSIATSLRPSYEYAAGYTPGVGRVNVPTALAVFPHDLTHLPRTWAERTYNIVQYTVMPHGGHFAPHEEPRLLAADITAFVRLLH